MKVQVQEIMSGNVKLNVKKFKSVTFGLCIGWKGIILWKFKFMSAVSMFILFRFIKCMLYEFPYPILPNEMVKQKTPKNAYACISGHKFCCKD